MKLTVPTMLTLARIVMIPVLVAVFYLPYTWTNFAAAFVFAFASVTDWLDGYIARRWHQYSAFGAFLDPVADKLMVATALFLIVQSHPTKWMAVWAAVIVGREIAVSALREWMAELGQRKKVAVATVGKIKTIVQMVALTLLLYQVPFAGIPVFTIGEWMLAVAALLTLWSGWEYLRAAWPSLLAETASSGVDSR
jgi:CDP-diacylglycerol---glycerol-3-phosphate 3-phosphatidyltransferase